MKFLSYIFAVISCLFVLTGCGKEPLSTPFLPIFGNCPKEEPPIILEPRPGLQVLKLVPVERLTFRILPGSPPLDFSILARDDRFMRFTVTFEVGEEGRTRSITLFNPGVPEVESIVMRTIGSWQYEADCTHRARIRLTFNRAANIRFSCELISFIPTKRFLECNGIIDKQQLHRVVRYQRR